MTGIKRLIHHECTALVIYTNVQHLCLQENRSVGRIEIYSNEKSNYNIRSLCLFSMSSWHILIFGEFSAHFWVSASGVLQGFLFIFECLRIRARTTQDFGKVFGSLSSEHLRSLVRFFGSLLGQCLRSWVWWGFLLIFGWAPQDFDLIFGMFLFDKFFRLLLFS